ncbi:MAG: ferredoxin [Alphaproteobacteria bacterium]|nr:ferredoxin [Alphaproteobacteria bacterium]
MRVLVEKCASCLAKTGTCPCVEVCPVMAISQGEKEITIDQGTCLNCGCCSSTCPNDAIEFE